MGKKKYRGKNKAKDKSKKTNRNRWIYGLIGVVIILVIGVVLINEYRPERLFELGKKEVSPQQLAKDYDNYAGELLEPLKVEMAKPVSPYKFMLSSIEKVENLLWKGLDQDSTLTTAWEKLGYVNAQFHGKQALLRYDSYKNRGNEEKMLEEEKNAILYFAKADLYYDKALEFGHAHPDRIYFGKAEAATAQYNYPGAAINLLKAIEINPEERMYKAKLIDAFLYSGEFTRALSQIKMYRKEYPESELSYRNLGSYYLFRGDTANAVVYYMEAIEKGTKPEVGKFLHKYFSDRGDEERADYYLQKVYEAQVNWDPDRY